VVGGLNLFQTYESQLALSSSSSSSWSWSYMLEKEKGGHVKTTSRSSSQIVQVLTQNAMFEYQPPKTWVDLLFKQHPVAIKRTNWLCRQSGFDPAGSTWRPPHGIEADKLGFFCGSNGSQAGGPKTICPTSHLCSLSWTIPTADFPLPCRSVVHHFLGHFLLGQI